MARANHVEYSQKGKRKYQERVRRHGEVKGHITKFWRSGLPFFENTRGVLLHRVKEAHAYFRDCEYSHASVTYWCGNSGQLSHGQLTADPPKDAVLCTQCERLATAAGEKTAEELTGRHVHVGRARVERLCCQPTN